MTRQFLRQCDLLVTDDSGNGINLSELKIEFNTFAADAVAILPPLAYIRVYNLRDETTSRIMKEFTKIYLQAGYRGAQSGKLFSGTIIQTTRGAIDARDRFIDIVASDLDYMFSFGTVNKTIAAGSTKKQRAESLIAAAEKFGAEKNAEIPDSFGTGGTLPRGKVQYGMLRDQLADMAETTQTSCNIHNGVISFVPLTGYAPGEIVKINSRTGMIGVPRQTNDGIVVDCLINPMLRIGTRIQIDNRDLVTQQISREAYAATFRTFPFPANLNNNGIYKVLVIEHEGDTRGDTWVSHLTCLSVDSSSDTVSRSQ